MNIRRSAGVTAALVLGLAGCGDDGSAASGGSTDGLAVVASFYPLQFVAERLLGDAGEVSSLTKPGAEPHDLELTPKDVAAVGGADLVVYLSGFQPAVDDAVSSEAADHSYDVADDAELDLTYTPIEEGAEATEEAGSTDPHFWLDPTRLATVSDALAQRLGELDADRAEEFSDRAATLRDELEALDAELATGLSSCQSTDLVTSHNAFGYLAQRYGMDQIGITGLTPDEEPSPADLAAVTAYVRDRGVRTIYTETLVSQEIAATVADETGARTEVLDPIEGLSDESEGEDYVAIMRSNLAHLQAGQPCP